MIDRLNAAFEGRYRIEGEIGAGGMATVYLAEDIKHHRKVAVKVLRPELAAVVGADRFLSEIETTANLQHPHILPLFDSGEADSLLYYVMPYVEGESLREKLGREKQIAVGEAVEVVQAVALALQYAHDHGVVHRDIKPGNILLQAGQPFVADFGIALALRAAGGSRITETGLSLGTPHYMSPEQASGDREVDHRSDIYSLGCVLYEMLVGDPPHTGATLQSVLAKLLSEEPRPISLFRKTVPRNVEAAAARALARVPADRFRSAGEFAHALGDPGFGIIRPEGSPREQTSGGSAAARRWLPWGVAAVASVIAILGWMGSTPDPPTSRFSVALPAHQPMTRAVGRALALSPDGNRLVYVGAEGGPTQLFVRERDELLARPLPGTVGAAGPFFSPDGEWVGFSSESRLKKVAIAGGPPVPLADAGGFRGGTWTEDGQIIYAPSTGEGLWAVPADGGTPVHLTTPRTELGESSHRFPDALPGGRAVLLTIFTGNLSDGAVAVYDLDTDEIRTLVPGAFYGRWVPSGHVAYLTEGGTLLVQRFDPRRLELTGGAVAVAEGLSVDQGAAGADYGVSGNGTLVYRRSSAWDALVRVDRDGREEVLADSLGGLAESLRFSPNGRSLVFGLDTDIWIHDLDGGSPVRRTFEGTNRYPTWTPDGERVSFASRRPGTNGLDLMAKPADGSGRAEVVYEAEHEQYEHEWTRAGALLVRQTVPGTGRDIWLVPPDGAGSPEPLVMTRFNERAIALSPGEDWLAYVSNESGNPEVYVRPFPGPAGKWLISSAGGQEPAWSPDGRELFYRAGGKLMAARLDIGPGGSSVRVLERRVLFDDLYGGNTDHTDYAVHPTEGWFVFTRSVGPPPELIWLDNWFAELRSR